MSKTRSKTMLNYISRLEKALDDISEKMNMRENEIYESVINKMGCKQACPYNTLYGCKKDELNNGICIIDAPTVDVETISDGYHTFADLYEQRMILSAALAKNNPHAWKSKLHEDGSLPFGGEWFIMGFDTADGEYTYHYELKDWDLFECKEIPCGKPWDGHTSKDVRRLLSLPGVEPKRGEWITHKSALGKNYTTCSNCNSEIALKLTNGSIMRLDMTNASFCPNCGADMRKPD